MLETCPQCDLAIIIRVGVKTIRNDQAPDTYKGTVRVVEPDQDVPIEGYRHHVKGRRYSVSMRIERLSAADALVDAMAYRDDCIAVNQLP